MPNDIEHLNADCACITLDLEMLCRTLTDIVGNADYCRDLAASHPHLISQQPLFLTTDHATRMQRVVAAVESVVANPGYQAAVQTYAPEIAQFRPGPVGVFMGYDFHLGPDGPRLIEINTNAGGALINAYVREAHLVCCGESLVRAEDGFALEPLLAAIVETFRSEWRQQRATGTIKSIAIVDRSPETQYLHPEFVLFRHLFERHGIRAIIADPTSLEHREGAVWIGTDRIDLVYNRLTDFDLSEPESATLRNAYLAGDVVVTPNPWAHAHFADKRNLALLCDHEKLRQWGIASGVIATLAQGIPHTVRVTPAMADALWSDRRNLFFKPCRGYGSKAAYRGEKLTRKVWDEILAGSYVAQKLVPPSTRTISIDGRSERLKADLRCYTYAGRLLLPAARLYQGQTTNFRTPGGGFAPVLVGAGDADCHC